MARTSWVHSSSRFEHNARFDEPLTATSCIASEAHGARSGISRCAEISTSTVLKRTESCSPRSGFHLSNAPRAFMLSCQQAICTADHPSCSTVFLEARKIRPEVLVFHASLGTTNLSCLLLADTVSAQADA